MPVFCHPFAHCLDEIIIAVLADAGGFVRGNIGGVNGPHRSGHFQAAGEGLAARRRMAGNTVASRCQPCAGFGR